METICSSGGCLLAQISWLWYAISVIVVFATGALWYSLFFSKAWIKAVRYECTCGAKLYEGEKCTCKTRSFWPMAYQFIATMLLALMYFVLVPYSPIVAILVAVAISGWMKAGLKFRIAEWKRFVILACVDVGYFFLSSLIFIGFACL